MSALTKKDLMLIQTGEWCRERADQRLLFHRPRVSHTCQAPQTHSPALRLTHTTAQKAIAWQDFSGLLGLCVISAICSGTGQLIAATL